MELKGFKKLNESVSPELLSPDELAVSENLVLDEEIGRPYKRFGWARYNSNPTAGTILSLHEVVTSDNSNYLLAGHSGKIQKSLNGTGSWSDVTTNDSGANDKGDPPYKMQAYADEFIFTEGSVAPFIVSGDALDDVYDLEIEAPDISSIETGRCQTLLGDLEINAFYKWAIVYVTETGQKSIPSNLFTHSINNGGFTSSANFAGAVGRNVGFRFLPVSTDARVTQKYIYRTMGDSDALFFHSALDNSTTEWYDTKADSELGSEEFDYLNIPKTADYISLHRERIILGNLTRTVKNYIIPAHEKTTTAQFTATVNGQTYTFDTTFDFGAGGKDYKGIKDCYAKNNASGNFNGDYTVRVVFYDETGLMSDPLDSNVITVDGITNNAIVIPSVPNVAATYDGVKRAEIYLKKNSGDFKLSMEYDPHRSVTTNLLYFGGLEIYDDTTTTTYATNQTTDTEKCAVAFSEIGQPATFILEDIRNIFPDDGDQITGVFDDLDGILIFKEKSICKIFTNGAPDNWRLVKVQPNIGCDEPNSLIKYGNTYAFSFQDSIYTWNSQNGLKEIGIEIWDTLSQVTAYHCATADTGWYMFGVSGAGLTTGYGFLIYDYNLETWYKFTTTTIPYVAKIKENNNDIGTILTSSGTYLLWYSEAVVDSDTGSDVQITPILRTKTFGEAIALQRLRKIKFNYKKFDGQNVVITLVNPDTAVTNTYTDSTDATIDDGWKLYESPVKDTDSLKETSKFYINITGAGLSEFGSLRVESKPILRGKREQS